MYNFITKYAPDMKWGAVPFPYPKDRPDLANSTIADEDILVSPDGDVVDMDALDPLVYIAGAREYRRLGGKVADAFSIGQTLG